MCRDRGCGGGALQVSEAEDRHKVKYGSGVGGALGLVQSEAACEKVHASLFLFVKSVKNVSKIGAEYEIFL